METFIGRHGPLLSLWLWSYSLRFRFRGVSFDDDDMAPFLIKPLYIPCSVQHVAKRNN